MARGLEVRDVGLRRGGREVLTGVSASFPEGRVTAIVGPSGAGKTSLLRCMNRLEEPEQGEVLLDGEDIRSLEPTQVRRRVGMIFQTPVLFPGGVRKNLAYGLDALDDERAGAALEGAGLGASFLGRESVALSVGQAQRVSIARALVRDPEMLLMDEPTSALDKDAAAKIESLVCSLADGGLGVVIVTHDLAQAERVATHGVLLVDGQVRGSGAIEDLRRDWPGEPA